MKTQDAVESEAQAEISKKRTELLRVQQELSRKLKHADKQRSKRKKLNESLPQTAPKVCLPLSSLLPTFIMDSLLLSVFFLIL